MMKRRRVLWVTLGLLALLAAAGPLAYYLRAKLAGEHFFLCRSTSYRSHQVRHRKDWEGSVPAPDKLLILLSVENETGQPPILNGGPSAIPVLLDLMGDKDSNVRYAAID